MAACSVALGKCNWVQSGAKVQTRVVFLPGVPDHSEFVGWRAISKSTGDGKRHLLSGDWGVWLLRSPVGGMLRTAYLGGQGVTCTYIIICLMYSVTKQLTITV